MVVRIKMCAMMQYIGFLLYNPKKSASSRFIIPDFTIDPSYFHRKKFFKKIFFRTVFWGNIPHRWIFFTFARIKNLVNFF